MIIEMIRMPVPPKKGQELGKALASYIGPIQVQPGCVSCQLTQPWPSQNQFLIEARWDSQESLVGHLRSDIYKRLLLLMELGDAPPVLEFFTVVEIRGLDLVETVRTATN